MDIKTLNFISFFQAIGLVKPIHHESLPRVSASASGGAGAPAPGAGGGERKPRPQKEQALNCPRCNSTNTKFCYYNNYSLTQPRYFCKTCRRYWTEGGTLRNVPVGGGSRKNKRSSSSISAAISSSSTSPCPSSSSQPHPSSSILKKLPSDLTHLANFPHQNPKIHNPHDLNLSGFIHLPYNNNNHDPKSLSSLMSMPISVTNSGFYSSVLPMQDNYNKPKLNFCLDGFHDDHHGTTASASARIFLPYEDLKPISINEQQQQQQNGGEEGGESNGYWSGMLGGGSW